jgi:hypothetical protein
MFDLDLAGVEGDASISGGSGGVPIAGGHSGADASAGVGGSGRSPAAGAGGQGGAGGSVATGGSGSIDACSADATSPCWACACRSCAQDMATCSGDPGCSEIRACAQQTGCSGAQCYQPSACRTTIDAWSGPSGASTALAIELTNCIRASQCQCPDPPTSACDPAFCPSPTFGSGCCVTSDGPCGIQIGMGCVSFGQDAG